MRAAPLRLQLWQGALDSMSARVAILDAQGEVIVANAAWQRSGRGRRKNRGEGARRRKLPERV